MDRRPVVTNPEPDSLYVYPDAHDVDDLLDEDDRPGDLVEALARLEAATRLRDGDAAARILGGLSRSSDGQWLLRQCVAAGLREVATVIAQSSDLPVETPLTAAGTDLATTGQGPDDLPARSAGAA
jgi:hypothetical protein